jgi:hypothetical protein
MSGFLKWLAPKLGDVRRTLRDSIIELHKKPLKADAHARTPAVEVELFLGAKLFLQVAVETEMISEHLAETLRGRIWEGLSKAADHQGERLREHEPTQRFLALLRSAIASGGAYPSDEEGNVPDRPLAAGWHLVEHKGISRRPRGVDRR